MSARADPAPRVRTAGVVTSRRDGRMVMYRLTARGHTVVTVLLDVDHATEGAEHG